VCWQRGVAANVSNGYSSIHLIFSLQATLIQLHLQLGSPGYQNVNQSAGANHELRSLSTACSSHNKTAHVILYSETLIKCSLEELKTGDDDESKVVSQLCQTVAGRLID